MSRGSDRPESAPRLTDGSFLVRRALEITISRALAEAGRRLGPAGDLIVLDVGGRGKPYAELVASRLSAPGRGIRHLALDRGEGADIRAAAEALPAGDGRVDLVLCTQVLEHVADPLAAVAEMARVLKPGGRCVLTTHGTWFYHPDPQDLWRWTSAGLRRLFEQGGFGDIEVSPVGGTKLSLVVLALNSLERAAGDGIAGSLVRRLLVAPLNAVASPFILRRAAGRESLPGELALNYLVSAARPTL